MTIHIEEKLRGLDDRRYRRETNGRSRRIAKIGYCFHLIQIRAGQHEKIAQHPVAVPVGRKVREAVEKIIAALAVPSTISWI